MEEDQKKELIALKGQISKCENRANAIEVNSQETYVQAIDIVSKLKETGTNIKLKKESITKPLNEALKNARKLFAPVEEQFAKAEVIIKQKLLAYKKKIDAEAEEEEEKIAAKVEGGKMKFETGEKKIEKIERVDNTTKGKVGAISVKIIKKVRITDAALLPREYLIPDQVAIRRDALGGKPIPGVEVYNEEIIAAK